MAVTGKGPYDPQNIFAKILRGEIPCKPVFENEWVLAFKDIAPKAPVHVLIIPNKPCATFMAFSNNAPAEANAEVMRCAGQSDPALGLAEQRSRRTTLAGSSSGEEVPHFHLQLMGGGPLPAFPQ